MIKFVCVLLVLMLIVTACGDQPAPAPIVTSASPAPTAAAVASPMVSLSPTAPAATATPTPVPPTPTPTPLPAEWLSKAKQAVNDGDYAAAAADYQAVIDGAVSPDQAEAAAIEQAITYLRAADYGAASDAAARFIKRFPSSARAADAWFVAAEARFAQGQYTPAVEAYGNYLKQREVIAGYVNERLGDAYTQLGDLAKAASSYEAALNTATSASDVANLREKLALTDRQLGKPTDALAQYEAILSFAQQPAYRASIMLQAGQTQIDAGNAEAGYQRFIDLINTYPAQNAAYQALVALVNAGVAVNEFQRGLVDYYAKQYDAAIAAFNRFIAAQADHGNAHYYIGLSYKDAGNLAAAIKAFDEIIDQHPEASRWGDAWLMKAEAQAAGGNLDGALKTLTTLAEKYPDSPQAPIGLWTAAGYLERQGEYERAIDLNLQLQVKYPNDQNASEALFDAALDAVRVDQPTVAISAWQTLSETYPLSQLYAASVFWQGKTLLDVDAGRGRAILQQLAAGGLNYYNLRAADVLNNNGRLPFVSADLSIDPDEGRAEAEVWLGNWLGLDPQLLRALPDRVTSNARFQRGAEFWRLGKVEEARAEFLALRQVFNDDAAALYPLAVYYRDIGLYYPSIVAAARLVALSPAGTAANAPKFLARLVYPIYYRHLVEPEAAARQIDPLVVFALMRAESLFDGLVTSSAAAGGLMQIIPPTGAQIAGDLNWPGYTQRDLYRPVVNVKFGVYYLRRYGLDYLDQDMFAAWAAYNGGPGNARRWKDASNGDVDLFVENISLGETRLYIDRLRENLAMYQRLYGTNE